MRVLGLMGMGAAIAALVSVPVAQAQTDPNTSTINSNQQISNHGLPHQAPAIGLSSIYGLNPCATGSALGISTPLVGVGGAISTIDKECETRNNAAIAVSALQDAPLAREILCNISDFRQASIRLGRPCLVDQKPGSVSAAPSVPAQATPAAPGAPTPPQTSSQLPPNAVPPPVARPLSASLPDVGLPAFCRTPGLVLHLYPMCSADAQPQPTLVPHVYQAAARVRPLLPLHSASSRKASASASRATVPPVHSGLPSDGFKYDPLSGNFVQN